MRSQSNEVRILAVIPEQLRPVLLRKLAPLKVTIAYAERASEVGRLLGQGALFQVALLPAACCDVEWWALWGELCLIDPRPEVLVYAHAASFRLWTGVLDMGGFDVIVEPFSDPEIQGAVLRAIDCFYKKTPRKE